jgi:hypothetical protein
VFAEATGRRLEGAEASESPEGAGR